jgi:subtilisin family serine protease
MKNIKPSLIAAIVVISAISCQKEAQINKLQEAVYNTAVSSPIENQYVIRIARNAIDVLLAGISDYNQRDLVVKDHVESMLNLADLTEVEVGYVYNTAIIGFAATLSDTEKAILANLPAVISIEQNLTVHISDNGRTEMNKKSAQETPYGINRVGKADGTGKRVFVIDTGVDLDHPDLNVNIDLSISYTGGGLIGELTGTGNGNDDHGHGSHVAGTIAAKDNTIGVVGVAHDAEVVAVKVLASNGSGSMVGVIKGVDHVAFYGMPGDVANMSLSGGAFDALDIAVIYASTKVMFALAAGNERDDANNYSPARANGLNIYTVSAMNSSDRWAGFSNYSNPPVDFCAPGVSVKSTYKNGRYATMSGTSMAAPHVAGILLNRGGTPLSDGTVSNDPDGTPDLIAVSY